MLVKFLPKSDFTWYSEIHGSRFNHMVVVFCDDGGLHFIFHQQRPIQFKQLKSRLQILLIITIFFGNHQITKSQS